jgi:hypothetical protein
MDPSRYLTSLHRKGVPVPLVTTIGIIMHPHTHRGRDLVYSKSAGALT